MTAQQAVLSLGTVTLTGCGAGLVLVHDSNPLLKGLNWMGGALVIGGVGAGLTLGSEFVPALEPLANLCILLAFVSCFRADSYLMGLSARFSRTSAALIGLQCAAMLAQWLHLFASRGATVILSILLAIQVSCTARLILRHSGGRLRLAARSTVGMMCSLVAANLGRGLCAAAGLMTNSPWTAPLNLLSYSVFIGAGTALAFAFFWRTTAKLSGDLEHMASTDPLTRVFNRRVFLNWCGSEQSRSRRLHAPFSLLMLDFDHFKKVNDTYGHHVGDQVLCAAVERIQDSIRGIDVLCRWGGEEFAVLLPNASEEATLIVAERVRRNIRLIESSDPRFADETFAELQLSASIGTATYDGEDDDFQAMLQRADEALYEAKRSGRNRVVRSTRAHSATEVTSGRLALEAQ